MSKLQAGIAALAALANQSSTATPEKGLNLDDLLSKASFPMTGKIGGGFASPSQRTFPHPNGNPFPLSNLGHPQVTTNVGSAGITSLLSSAARAGSGSGQQKSSATDRSGNGEVASDKDIAVVEVGEGGVLKIPVVNAKGEAASFWICKGSFNPKASAASKTEGLSIQASGPDAADPVIASAGVGSGEMTSKFFRVPPGAKTLGIRFAGKGDISQVSLALDVDGNNDVFAMGPETATALGRVEWNISKLAAAGSLVRIRIHDGTNNGFAAVAGIGETPPAPAPAASEKEAKETPSKPNPFAPDEFGDEYFISSDVERRIVQSYAALSLAYYPEESKRPIKGASSVLREIETRIGARMIEPDFDHVPGMTKEFLAAKIKKEVFKILAEEKIDPKSIEGQRCLARGVCDWVRSHLIYNQALMPNPSTGKYDYPNEVLRRFWTTDLLLKESSLFVVCAGTTRVTKDLSSLTGLNCEIVLGFYRFYGNTTASQRDHGWVVYIFEGPDGRREFCPADNAQALVLLSRARAFRQVPPNPFCLPNGKTALSLFMWRLHPTEADGGGPLKAGLGSRLSTADWKAIPRDPVLEKVMVRVAPESQKATVRIPVQ